MNLTKVQKALIHTSLSMWANWIETGDVLLSAKDANAAGKRKIIKPLDKTQMQLIVAIRNLAGRMLNEG